jgi:hypothetical protein
MSTATLERPRQRGSITVVKQYDVAADAKKRISLQGAATKYFHVMALSNGAFMLEPRVLVPPHAISASSLKMLEKAAANLKKGLASPSIDLSQFLKARIKLSALPPAKPKPGAKN